MKQILAPLFFAILATSPAYAEDPKSDIQQGLELFFEGLKDELAPALDEFQGMARQFGPSLQSFFEEMGPALAEMMTDVKDWSRYEMPEMLPNGDIIIRRKPGPEPEEPVMPESEGEKDSGDGIDI